MSNQKTLLNSPEYCIGFEHGLSRQEDYIKDLRRKCGRAEAHNRLLRMALLAAGVALAVAVLVALVGWLR